ncbi:hypothetical protein AMTR_s00038p00115150 [Amborella trichopoda]|uniref:Fungal lipase-type domain-containing protein n=1 Tax=Amborella trichopoda TaxID=13333 RepID=U5CWP4_AMBTC|nr:hypothetical protein AMTR_s00038p00115150 [Amborella trichopoda]
MVQKLGRRDIMCVWRGTVTYLEWVEDLIDYQMEPKFGPDDKVRVESGFLDLYNSKSPPASIAPTRPVSRYMVYENVITVVITVMNSGVMLCHGNSDVKKVLIVINFW